MNIQLRPIKLIEREVLRNLWEKYDYDSSCYDNNDVDEFGLYECKDFDYYWTKEIKWGYFIIVDGKLAGFVMLTNIPVIEGTETDFTIGEFFVMIKYRRLGVGRNVLFQVLNKHRGRQQLVRNPNNILSVHFWDNVINEYTGGQYTLIRSHPRWTYPDGTPGDVFFFES